MKKILSILACVCVLLSLVVVGTVSAEDATANEIVLTVDSLGLASQSYSADTATVDEVGFEWVQLGNYGDGIQVRDKNGNTSTLWNTSAFPAAIKEIKLTYSSTKDVTYANADAEIFSFGNKAGTYGYSTKLSTTAGVKEYTITPDAETYTFFKFEHDLGYTLYWDSITIVLVADQNGGESGGEGDDAGNDDAAVSEVDLTVDSLGLASQSYSADTATVDGVAFEWVQLGNYGDGIQVRDKNGNTSTLWNTSAFPAAIKEIKLTYSSTKSVYDNANAEIFSFGNAAGTYDYSTKLSTTAGVKEYTITPDAETYTFFKFEHDLGYTMYWDSIKIVLVADQNGGEDDDAGDDTVPATLAEQIEQANGLANGEYLAYESTITGTIEGTVTASNYTEGAYKFTVSDGTNSLLCYYVPVTGGEPKEGDTVTVTGNLTAYNGAAQFDDTATAVLVGGESGGEDDDDDSNTGDDAADLGVVDTVEAGKAYKFGMVQGNLNDGNVYYLTGEMNGYYMDTTTDAASAIDVYLEETTGGYYLYTTDGTTKTYINMVVSGTHVNGAYEATASTVYTYDAEAKTLVADIDGVPYWFGTRNDKQYTTVGPCATEYEGFYGQFYVAAADNTGDENVGGETGGENADNNDSNEKDDESGSPVTGNTTDALVVAMGVISVAATLLFVSKKRALN